MGSLKRNIANNILSGGKFDATDLSGTIPASNVNNDSLTNVTSFSPTLGDTIQSVASDPPSLSEGDVWYNTTDGILKGVVQFKAWSSGGNTVIGGYGTAGAGTQTAGLIFGRLGEPVGGPPVSGATEEYDGTSWTEQSDLNTARRYTSGFGTQTSGVCAGGYVDGNTVTSNSEEYDGSSWTEGNNLNTARYGAGAAGTLTAGLVFGGTEAPPRTTVTETYDGTSYSEVNDMNTQRENIGGVGTQTAALAIGGGDPNASVHTESWDGTNWTTISNMNITRKSAGAAGTQTHAIYFAGNAGTGYVTTSEEWDGTSWASGSSMATNRGYLAGAGTATAAFGATGYVPSTPAPNRIHTEEYNSSINQTYPGSFSSAPSFSTQRAGAAGTSSGTQSAYAIFGGEPLTASTEEYDGSAWTSGGNLPTATYSMGGSGTLTAGLANDGYIGAGYPVGQSPRTYEYNGTSWTDVGSGRGTIATYGFASVSTGTQTAALGTGGYTAGASPSDEYNGSTWTTGGAIIDNDPSPSNNQIYSHSTCGTQTAALLSHGSSHSPSSNPANYLSETQLYNGTSWTNAPATVNRVTSGSIAFGNQTSAIYAGGFERPSGPSGGALITQSQTWDGTSWAAGPNTGTASSYGSAGSPSAGIISDRRNNATKNVEEWNGPFEAETASTISTE